MAVTRVTTRSRCAAWLWCLLPAVPAAQAAGGLNINATRVVVTQAEGGTRLITGNSSDIPYLMNIRFSATPDGKGSAPFLASPPVYRLEAGGSNVVKIMAGDTRMLPRDRESVFYLSANGIPRSNPLTRDGSGFVGGGLSYAVGNQIKLFYRPTGLPGTAKAAISGLKLNRVAEGVRVSNPSAYHVTLASLRLGGQSVTFNATQPAMLAPFGSATYRVHGAYPISAAGKAEWKAINDSGAQVRGEGVIQ
ncbi:TPA: molecular chaperone [Serratia liquefaciens]